MENNAINHFMRLWTIHPKYLDAKGLVACWREGLLAKKVLENRTKGYKNHPQLIRFRNFENPLEAINQFLDGILKESKQRGYNFDDSKIETIGALVKIPVNEEQVKYEFSHLKKKLRKRDKAKYKEIAKVSSIEINPVFNRVPGGIESWEIVK